MSKSRGVSLTKKKFYGIIDLVRKYSHTLDSNFEEQLKTTLNFDPTKSSYDPVRGKKISELRRQKALEEGKAIRNYDRKKLNNDFQNNEEVSSSN